MTILSRFPQLLQVAAPAGGNNQFVSTIVMFGLVFLIFYFLIIRPQSKRQKETKRMLAEIKKGDKIQTIGGIRGTIVSVKEDSIIVKVDSSCDMEFVRSAIATVINPETKAVAKPKEKAAAEPKVKAAAKPKAKSTVKPSAKAKDKKDPKS